MALMAFRVTCLMASLNRYRLDVHARARSGAFGASWSSWPPSSPPPIHLAVDARPTLYGLLLLLLLLLRSYFVQRRCGHALRAAAVQLAELRDKNGGAANGAPSSGAVAGAIKGAAKPKGVDGSGGGGMVKGSSSGPGTSPPPSAPPSPPSPPFVPVEPFEAPSATLPPPASPPRHFVVVKSPSKTL